ncbi:MAG: hypothetical protein IT236_16770, partial [Bacteroidia bacterium]|nr:hypothetical protein [Bacteroidia bacterium]
MLCCTAQALLAQQPAYFIMGEDQFSGVQIYRIIQDKKLNYWIATNEGLYYYNFYNFEKVSCDKAKSNSMFNFVINRQGVIYCHNLNNQIFKIENNTCEVFYELKSDEESADISLVIAKDDNLLVRTKKIIALNKQGQVLAKISSYNHYISEGLATDNSGIQFQIDQRDTLIIYDAGKFYKRNLKIKEGGSNQLNLFKFFKINNVTYAVDIKSKKQYRYQADTYELVSIKNNPAFERSESIRIYETGNEIWIAGTLPGTTRLDQTNFSSNQ